MYCRACKNIRQDKYGGIYCCINGGESVGLNQVCNINKFELDGVIFSHIELDDNTRIDVDVEDNRYQLFNFGGNLNIVSRKFSTTLKARNIGKDNIEIEEVKDEI